jgi:integrase
MSIYMEKKKGKATGVFIVEVEIEGKRHRKYTRDPKEAKRLDKQLRLGMVDDEPSKKETTAYTLGDLFDNASRELWRGDKDERMSVMRFRTCVEMIGRDKVLSDLRTTDIDALIEQFRTKDARPRRATSDNAKKVYAHRDRTGAPKAGKLKGDTIDRYLAALSKGLTWASKRQETTGFIQRVHFDWQGEKKQRTAWLTPADEDRLCGKLEDNGRDDVALIVRVLIATGVRIGELLKLTADDVQDSMIFLEDRKNSDDAYQPIPEALAHRLRALMEHGMPSYPSIKKAFYKARDALSMDPELTLHCLRHTTGTRLGLAGVDLNDIQDVLGHKSINTTRRYRHAVISVKQRALSALQAYNQGLDKA